jgi:SulP family sulfate permease
MEDKSTINSIKTDLPRSAFPFLRWIDNVDRHTARSDFFAGLANAVIVLPQGVAFSLIAGMPPEYGLYTAMIPPIIAGLFGSSYHLISGPTTPISLVIFAAVTPFAAPATPHYISLVLTLTFIAGVIQLALGAARLGTLTNFISHSVVVGFTAGAAALIATSQVKHTLGVAIPDGESFFHTWISLAQAAAQINIYSAAIAVLTMLIVLVSKRLWPKSPSMLLGMLAGAALAAAIGAGEHGVRLVGALPSHLPPFSIPDFSHSAIKSMASSGLAVAMLALISAASISRSIAAKSGQSIDGNQEFIGQGLSNIVGSFFSCYASSGSFTRSGLNYDAGAKTPLSAVFAAVILALIVLLAAPLAAYLPIASMGGVVLLVAYDLVDFSHVGKILRASGADSSVMIITFLAAIFAELDLALYVGVMLSLALYLNRTASPRIVSRTPNPKAQNRGMITDPDAEECPQVKIIRIDGSIYFGSVNHVEKAFDWIRAENPERKYLLLLCGGINFLDVSGADALEREALRYQKMGGGLYYYGMKAPVREFLLKGGYMAVMNETNFFASKTSALATIIGKLDETRCAPCQARIFLECKLLPGGETDGD